MALLGDMGLYWLKQLSSPQGLGFRATATLRQLSIETTIGICLGDVAINCL